MRFVACFIIAFQLFFLNVFAPLHTRGAITVGRPAAAQADAGCCAARKDAPAGRHEPTPLERKYCAVCCVVAHSTPPDPTDFRLDAWEVVRLAAEAATSQVRSTAYPTPFWSTAPPPASCL